MDYEFKGLNPMGHQYDTIKFLLANKRAYNLSDMGTGKTASTIWALDILLQHDKINCVLIICPLSIIYTVWKSEIETISHTEGISIIHGPKNDRINAIYTDAKFFITNHDCVRGYESDIINRKFDAIIVDEVTAFKHTSSDRTKSMIRIANSKHIKILWGLTGTPITTGPVDAFGLGKVVNPKNLPTPYITKYRRMVEAKIDMWNSIPLPGSEKIVDNILKPAIRYKLEECVDIKDISYSTRFVEMSKEQEKMYAEILRHQLSEYEDGLVTAINAASKLSKLLQISGGSVIDEDKNIFNLPIKSRYNELKKIIEDANGRIIIICQFIGFVDRLYELLKSEGYNIEKIYGSISVKLRSKIIEDFQLKKVDIIVAQVRTLSHGISLTASNYMCFYGPIMGVENYLQAVKRIRRIGQDKKQHIIKLVSSKAETAAYKLLSKKENYGQIILDLYKTRSL